MKAMNLAITTTAIKVSSAMPALSMARRNRWGLLFGYGLLLTACVGRVVRTVFDGTIDHVARALKAGGAISNGAAPSKKHAKFNQRNIKNTKGDDEL